MTGIPAVSTDGPVGDDASLASRKAALRRGEYPIAVYGMGKIGLPVAVAFAELTGAVTGVDTDREVIQSIEEGQPPFDHEPGLETSLPALVDEDQLDVTADGVDAARNSKIHIVVVPVPLSERNDADLDAILTVTDTIAAGLDPGDLVVIETTVPPGTSTNVVHPRLVNESGLEPGEFGVASCPERTSSGRALKDIKGAYPRVIGGVNRESTDAAYAVYDELINNTVITVDATTAETVKLFEGVYRDLNIALANELALAFDGSGVDVREAIEAANTQPYCEIHEPGAGVGGHCIPWYPYFLMEATDHDMELVRTARNINESMPHHLARRTISELEQAGVTPAEASVAILGLAYRPDIPETAASPAVPLLEHLEPVVDDVAIVDPVIVEGESGIDLLAMEHLPEYDPDAIVLVTAHSEFDGLPTTVLEDSVVIDGRDGLPNTTERAYVIGRDA